VILDKMDYEPALIIRDIEQNFQYVMTNLLPFPFSLFWIYVHLQGEEHDVLKAMVWGA